MFTAVFDAKLGERITAQSSAVGCDLTFEEKTGTASGACSVPLTSIKVDNEETKTEHFQQWVTNKKGEPKDCRLEAKLVDVKVGRLAPEHGHAVPQPTPGIHAIAVWRSGFDVFRTALELDEAAALESAASGDPLARVCATFGGREDAAHAAFNAVTSWLDEGWVAAVEGPR